MVNSKSFRKGFTLIELLIYVSIFVVAAGLLTSILVITSRVENNEIVSTQVGQELNLVLNTVQGLVRSASLVECANSGPADSNCLSSTGPNLKLRLENSTLDPTCVYLENGIVKLAQGSDPASKQNCNTAVATNLTTTKVTANSLTFTKFDVPGGHATVQVDAQFTYNSPNPQLQISKTLRSAVGRVSAATFDSDLLPDATNQRSIGTIVGASKKWKDIFLSGILGLGTYTDATEPVSTTAGTLYYNTTKNTVRVYDGAAWKNVSLWDPDINNLYYTAGKVGIGTSSISNVWNPKFQTSGGHIRIESPDMMLVFRESDQTPPVGGWAFISDSGTLRLWEDDSVVGQEFSAVRVPLEVRGANDNLILLKTGGNIGVGPAYYNDAVNPASRLTVDGTIESTGFKLTTAPGAGLVLTSNASGVGTWQAPSSGGPAMNSGITTGTMIDNTVSTSTVITHGLSVVPKIINVITVVGTTADGSERGESWGYAATDGVSSITSQNAITSNLIYPSDPVKLISGKIAASYYSGYNAATITAVTSTTLTITFPPASFSGNDGTPKFIWEVFR